MINFNLDKSKYCLVACSFGPDSMALLSMLLKEDYKLVVCHVNYHTRDISNDEERRLGEFCKEHSLIFECLDASTIRREGNFEAWARSVRYMFFKQMYVKYDAQCLFVGHQQDDLLETYLLQKDRHSVVARYGLEVDKMMDGMRVLRPLLVYTKMDLHHYCVNNNVPYSIDVTNFETKLKRNKIRHEIISKMTEMERDTMLLKISQENSDLEDFEQKLNKKVEIGEKLEIREILSLSQSEFSKVLMDFVNEKASQYALSAGQIKSIREMCLSAQPNNSMDLGNGFYLTKEYDVLVITEKVDETPYSYIMETPGIIDEKEIFVDFTNGAEDRNINLISYPLTIRTPKPGDKAIIGGYYCSVRRLFIDWKLPLRYRKTWPLFCNKRGDIIYIPRYRKNFIGDNKKSKITLKFMKN